MRLAVALERNLPAAKIVRQTQIAEAMGCPVRWAPHEIRDDEVPILGCMPSFRPTIDHRRAKGLPWLYMDSCYFGRRGRRGRKHGPFTVERDEIVRYRMVANGFQVTAPSPRPDDRFRATGFKLRPWRAGGKHIVVAAAPPRYVALHGIEDWLDSTVARLKALTDRPIRVRSKRDARLLHEDLVGAWALVTHGSMSAVEAIMLGVPALVDPLYSAAAPVARHSLEDIENPVMPDREAWVAGLAYEQWLLDEIKAGVPFREMGLIC